MTTIKMERLDGMAKRAGKYQRASQGINVAVEPEPYEALSLWTSKRGASAKFVVSRWLEWMLKQPASVQEMALGSYQGDLLPVLIKALRDNADRLESEMRSRGDSPEPTGLTQIVKSVGSTEKPGTKQAKNAG